MIFVKGRASDTMKQIPINATRFMIETKCLWRKIYFIY
jgi:hypothetical protein